jgi:NitT/TauT family transport system substrate-binding protein
MLVLPAACRAALMLATVAVAAPTKPAAAAEKLKLAQNQGPISGISIVADRKGFFAKNGLEVEVLNFTTGKQCLDTVMAGAADIATTAEAPTTAAAMSGQKIAFLARTEYSYLKTLTATSASIAALPDLKAKRLAFTAGTAARSTQWSCSRKQASQKKTWRSSICGRRTWWWLSQAAASTPTAPGSRTSTMARALGAKARLLDTKGIYAESFNIVLMQDYLEKNPEVAKSFLKSLLEAEAWLKANPDEATKVVAGFVNMPVNDLKPIWEDYVYGVALDQQVLVVLTAHASWRLASGNHPPGATMPDWRKIIFPEPLKSVAPDRVTIFK